MPFFRGMYVCRTLSYKGAEFEIIEAPLEEKMMVQEISMFLYLKLRIVVGLFL